MDHRSPHPVALFLFSYEWKKRQIRYQTPSALPTPPRTPPGVSAGSDGGCLLRTQDAAASRRGCGTRPFLAAAHGAARTSGAGTRSRHFLHRRWAARDPVLGTGHPDFTRSFAPPFPPGNTGSPQGLRCCCKCQSCP